MSKRRESTRKCFKCGASQAKDPDITLFRFPKAGKTNSLRCESWAKYCTPNKEWFSPEWQQKLHSEHRMLCNKHFKKTSFSDYPFSTKKLHKFAVPDDMEKVDVSHQTSQESISMTPLQAVGPDGFKTPRPIDLDEEAKKFYPISAKKVGILKGGVEIKTIVEEGEIDHNMYIPEVVDEILPWSDADFMQIDSSKSNIEENSFQKDVIRCFEQVSTTGLSEHDRKDLTGKHLLPGNCMLFGAPTLNPEVKAALSQMAIERDQAIEYKQAVLASAIASLVEAIGILVSSEDNTTDLLRLLVDTGRLLCDCQHNDSMSRRNCILNTVDKNMNETLQNSNIGSYLFGNFKPFHHNFKRAEAIFKSGADVTKAHGPKITKVIHEPVSAITVTPSSKIAKEMRKSSEEITISPRSKKSEEIHKLIAEVTRASRLRTTNMVHKSGAEINVAHRLKTTNMVYKSGAEINMPPKWKTAEAIHKSAAEITIAPTSKTAGAINTSGTDITLGPRLKMLQRIPRSGAEISMAPKYSKLNIIIPKKCKNPNSFDYVKKECEVIENDEKFELNKSLDSPS